MMCCSIPSKVTINCLSKLALAGRRQGKKQGNNSSALLPRQNAIPKKTQPWFKKKQQISEWLEVHRCEIASGALVVFFQDECHLLWGDLCGYVWGQTKARIEIPIVNERERQTYYGAVNFYTQECLIQAAQAGNSEGTIAFLKYLLDQCPKTRIALIWDGAT